MLPTTEPKELCARMCYSDYEPCPYRNSKIATRANMLTHLFSSRKPSCPDWLLQRASPRILQFYIDNIKGFGEAYQKAVDRRNLEFIFY